MRQPFVLAALFAVCSVWVHAAPVTNQVPRLSQAELESLYPKKLEGLENIGGIYQSRTNVMGTGWGYNRCERAYSDGNKRNLNVELRDTGGFTKEFIAHYEYLHLPVGAKDINDEAVVLINGNRGKIYSEKGVWSNIVLVAVLDRFEIEIRESAGVPVERLKAIASQFEEALKKKVHAVAAAK